MNIYLFIWRYLSACFYISVTHFALMCVEGGYHFLGMFNEF